MKYDAKRGGFTYVEVLIASFLSVALFIAVFEAMTFCKQSALATASLSGAESLAYDVLMEHFNKPLKWFLYESDPDPTVEMTDELVKGYFPPSMGKDDVVCTIDISRDSYEEGKSPWSGWDISVDVKWRTPGVPGLITRSGSSGKWHELPRALTIKRTILERHKPLGDQKKDR